MIGVAGREFEWNDLGIADLIEGGLSGNGIFGQLKNPLSRLQPDVMLCKPRIMSGLGDNKTATA